jgi:hypothetical protein
VKPFIEVASKIADALKVSLDYLAGKTSVEIDAKTLKRSQDIQSLNDRTKLTSSSSSTLFCATEKQKKLTLPNLSTAIYGNRDFR